MKPTDKYTIKPLKWRKTCDYSYMVTWDADTPFGYLRVQRSREECDEDKPWGPWTWSYCFSEYHDESSADCSSLAEGKRLCNEHWIGRITQFLEKV